MVVVLAAVIGAGCGGGGVRPSGPGPDYPSPAVLAKPPYAAGTRVGVDYEYVLVTHCGINNAPIDGIYWAADPELTDGSGNPPTGWRNPLAKGTLRLVSKDRARFEADGKTAFFRRAQATPGSCN